MIKDLDQKYNYKTKYLRCDNAGENHKTEEECDKEGLGIRFKYISPNPPQHNNKVERKVALSYGRIRSMMNGAALARNLRSFLWVECARTATKLNNLDCKNKDHEPRYKQFFKKNFQHCGWGWWGGVRGGWLFGS